MIKKIIFISLIIFSAGGFAQKSQKKISLEEYIKLSVKNDPSFQLILIDGMYLKYNKTLGLPVSDILVDVAGQYNLVLYESDTTSQSSLTSGSSDDTGSFEGTIALSKLFPMTGTALSSEYSVRRNYLRGSYLVTSTFGAEVSQPIARNAFGRSNRILNKKIGIENKLAKHQIVEAYEDYLASLMMVYMDWYSSLENLKAGKESLKYYKNLYTIVRGKSKYRIALPEDVQKIRLEVLSAEENIINLQDNFERYTIKIKETAGLKSVENILPDKPVHDENYNPDSQNLESYVSKTRTQKMIILLEKKGILSEKIAKDDLLPSLDLFIGYNVKGEDYSIKNSNHTIYGGITSGFGIFREREKAVSKTAEFDLKKEKLKARKDTVSLRTNLLHLISRINREKKLVNIAREKIKVSRRIFAAERKNYLIGRASLNDLILIQNNMIKIKYNVIFHEIMCKQLLVEWKRLTDVLVSKNDVLK